MTSSLFPSILLFYAILVVVNIPASFIGLKFESDSAPRLWYEPPGFTIPIIWFILFTLLGFARTALVEIELLQLQWWLFALAFLCASYAYYTLGFAKLTSVSALWFGLIGNVVVILFAVLVFTKLVAFSKQAAWFTFPVIVWTAFATVVVLGKLKQQNLLHL